MKEQAEREHRDLNDLVVERYGVRIFATLQPLPVLGHIKKISRYLIILCLSPLTVSGNVRATTCRCRGSCIWTEEEKRQS